MKKISIVIAATTLLASSIAFSHDTDFSSCFAIAKACKAAGFDRKSEDKQFWKDCMKPILLGKSVKGVDIKADEVKTCRDKKIDKMQKELKALQNVK